MSLLLVVKTLGDQTISFKIDESLQTIADVYSKLISHGTIPNHSFKLLSRGQVLSPTTLIDTIPSAVQATSETPITKTIHLFYYEPAALLVDPIDAAVDWDSKNRLRCFKGLYLVYKRDFASAASLLIDSLATFEEETLIPFKDVVKYAVIAAALVFDRPTLKSKVICSPEVLEVIDQIPHLHQFVQSYYNCQYKSLFE